MSAWLVAVGCAPLDGDTSSDTPTGHGTKGSGPIEAGEHNRMFMHDGRQRDYLVYAPPSYDGSKPVPLVIDFHGLTSNAAQQAAGSGWRAKADESGFIVVEPNGIDNSWNGGSLCCGNALLGGVDDEGFVRALVDRMRKDARIDAKRVYATGLSNGGAMSHMLGCRAADVFAAVAPVSMGNSATPCEPSRPISVVMFRGTQDTIVAYDGGLFPSAAADFEMWRMLDGCTGSAKASHEGLCQTYGECAAGVEVTLCSPVADHVLYDVAAEMGVGVADVAWQTFERHALP